MGQYSGLENKKILVVEDVELNQFLARRIMESWGCEVQIAENGAMAVEKIKNHDFDLVLMDIQMPVMDGIEATRLIRELKDTARSLIPIVALTANSMRADFEAYREAGMNDCLPKPFEEPALYQTILKNIRQSQSMNSVVFTTPGVAAQPTTKSYDLSMIETISGGDQSFITKMLKLFLETVPASLTEMRAHSEAQRWQDLSKVAHKLKSTIDSMGVASLTQTIRDIESNAKAGTQLGSLPSLVNTVISGMAAVMADIRKDFSL